MCHNERNDEVKKFAIVAVALALGGCVDSPKPVYEQPKPVDEYLHFVCSESVGIRGVDIPRFEGIYSPIGKYKTTLYLELKGEKNALSFISLTHGVSVSQPGSLIKAKVSKKARGDTNYQTWLSNSSTAEFPPFKLWVMRPDLEIADYVVALSMRSEKNPERYIVIDDAYCKEIK